MGFRRRLMIPAKSPNLFNEKTVTYGVWTSGTGNVTSASYGCISEKISVKDESYSVKKFGTDYMYSCSLIEYDSNGTFIKRNHHQGDSYDFTVQLNARTTFIALQVANGSSSSIIMTPEVLHNYKMMIVAGNTSPVKYYPY